MAKTQPIQIGLSTQTHDHVMSLHNLSTTKTMRSTEPRPSPEWLSFIRIIPFLPLLYHILKALSSVFLIFSKRERSAFIKIYGRLQIPSPSSSIPLGLSLLYHYGGGLSSSRIHKIGKNILFTLPIDNGEKIWYNRFLAKFRAPR
jgi:hypothetical protein